MKNRINIIGRLGKDPEKRFTPSGQEVCNFTVATSRKYTKAEETVEETIWFRIETWGKLANVCGQWLQKGTLVDIEGRMKPVRVYTKQDGTADAQLEISADSVTFLSGTRGKEQQEAAPAEDNVPF